MFNPMKYAPAAKRAGAGVTEEVKAGILEYVKIAAGSLKAKIDDIDSRAEQYKKDAVKSTQSNPASIAHHKRVLRTYENEKAPVLETLSALAGRWKSHQEEQWTGMNGYSQITKYAIEDVGYAGPFYPVTASTPTNVMKDGKPVRCLVAYTKDVILEDGRSKYNLGAYKIIIPLYTVTEKTPATNPQSIQFVPMRHLELEWIKAYGAEHRYRFPHHMWDSRTHGPYNCFSQFESSMASLMIGCDIVSLLSVCVRFQFEWNSGSPFGGSRPSELTHGVIVPQ